MVSCDRGFRRSQLRFSLSDRCDLLRMWRSSNSTRSLTVSIVHAQRERERERSAFNFLKPSTQNLDERRLVNVSTRLPKICCTRVLSYCGGSNYSMSWGTNWNMGHVVH